VRNGIETAIDRVALSAQPELDALSAIVAILQELPDEASRLRVMRWSFGRFSSEFKRPVAPELTTPRKSTAADFASQISELYDLFPSNPRGRDAVDDWLALSE